MVIDTSYSSSCYSLDARDAKIYQHKYKFIRCSNSKGMPSLLSGHMNSGDAITVSVEPHMLALARGFIVQLTPQDVVVGTDHTLDLDSIKARLTVGDNGPRRVGKEVSDVVFRIDKDEFFGSMGRLRDNLVQLLNADGDARRMELIVDLKPPRFYDNPDVDLPDHCSVSLNGSQQRAITKVLAARDYALILGMPGTGKTTVVGAIIRTLASMGKTVLLTSYTHSAVDAILLKLVDDAEFGILRLGNVDKVRVRQVLAALSCDLVHRCILPFASSPR
jgi:DNA replication ATP-dependent helicase Dna2